MYKSLVSYTLILTPTPGEFHYVSTRCRGEPFVFPKPPRLLPHIQLFFLTPPRLLVHGRITFNPIYPASETWDKVEVRQARYCDTDGDISLCAQPSVPQQPLPLNRQGNVVLSHTVATIKQTRRCRTEPLEQSIYEPRLKYVICSLAIYSQLFHICK